jgi:hypothetical protein
MGGIQRITIIYRAKVWYEQNLGDSRIAKCTRSYEFSLSVPTILLERLRRAVSSKLVRKNSQLFIASNIYKIVLKRVNHTEQRNTDNVHIGTTPRTQTLVGTSQSQSLLERILHLSNSCDLFRLIFVSNRIVRARVAANVNNAALTVFDAVVRAERIR